MKTADQILTISLTPDYKKEQKWKVFPNPVRDFIVLQSPEIKAGYDIFVSIYTIEGRMLLNEQQSAVNILTIQNLQTLPSGLLILKIKSGDSVASFRLNKIR